MTQRDAKESRSRSPPVQRSKAPGTLWAAGLSPRRPRSLRLLLRVWEKPYAGARGVGHPARGPAAASTGKTARPEPRSLAVRRRSSTLSAHSPQSRHSRVVPPAPAPTRASRTPPGRSAPAYPALPDWSAMDRPEQSPWLPPMTRQPAPDPPLPQPAPPPRTGARRVLGPLFVAAALVLKWGKAALLLLPKAKLLTTSASMLVSVAAYALIWGWTFAAGFVALLFIHEMGHVIQLRREGIKATAPLFIPFMGAFVGMKQLPDNAAAEARVGLAGPVLGAIGCVIPLVIYEATGNDFWKALAFTGFFLNLFNLLPVLPLDGGRAMAALSPWMWFVGFGLLVAATFLFPSPIMLLILLFGGMETLRRWRSRGTPESEAYHRVTRAQRITVAVVYVGLALALAVGMDATHVVRSFSDV